MLEDRHFTFNGRNYTLLFDHKTHTAKVTEPLPNSVGAVGWLFEYQSENLDAALKEAEKRLKNRGL